MRKRYYSTRFDCELMANKYNERVSKVVHTFSQKVEKKENGSAASRECPWLVRGVIDLDNILRPDHMRPEDKHDPKRTSDMLVFMREYYLFDKVMEFAVENAA